MSRLLPIASVVLLIATSVPMHAQSQTATPGSALSKVAAAKAKQHSLTMIQGNALNSTNGEMSNVVVRLRDARFGRIVDTQVTDKSGLFEFKAIDPGTYVVEIMGNDQSILAASELLNVNPGAVVSAVVKLPFRTPVLAGLMGNGSTPSATALAALEALGTVVAVVPTTPVSPNK
jgi:hypothetical protein